MAHPLKTYRESQKLSQQALADKLGVARMTIFRWETGAQKIDTSLLPEVSKKTGIPARDLRSDLVKELKKLVGDAQ